MATPSATNSRAVSPAASSDSDSPSRAESGSVSSKAIFSTSDTTFKPAPYNPPQRAASSSLRQSSSAPVPAPAPTFDMPQSTVPPFDGLFIHPPFDSLPDDTPVPAEGMNYSIMHSNPRWFLDIRDWITLDSSPEGALRYPRDLEPPRPRRQKDLLLRCTFCPRTYAGVNAKSMWTRHVREKHRVILSKAWTDTATSTKRAPTGKPTPSTSAGDLAPSPVVKKPPPTSASPASPSTMPVPKPRGKPGPKPKPGSPAKKKAGGAGKIVIPAQRPKPVAVPARPPSPPPPPPSRIVNGVVRKSASPPPPIGMLPPRMRAARKSFRPSQGPLELQQALQSQDPSTPIQPDTPQVPSVASVQDSTQVVDRDSIVSTPLRSTPDASAAPPPTTDTSLPPPSTADSEIQLTATPGIAGTPPLTSRASEDRESVQMDKEVADILLMDVDIVDARTPDESQPPVEEEVEEEDVDMELEDEEEELHPPISVGGLSEPVMFGFLHDAVGPGVGDPDPFSLSSRPFMASTPMFSPVASTANTPEAVREEEEVGTPDVDVEVEPAAAEEELELELEPPPLGRFKISSLAYLMDRSLAVSPPPSPGRSATPRSATPPPVDMDISSSSSSSDHIDTGGDVDVPPATMFAAMEDVFVIKMQNNMDPELKARLLGHLREQFGVEPEVEVEASLARLPEAAVRQIMSASEPVPAPDSTVAAAGSSSWSATADVMLDPDDLAGLTEDFLSGSRGQVKADLDEQLQEMVGHFMEEMAVPLQDELTVQLRDEIIGEVAEQMREALVTQGDEAQVEFEWRREGRGGGRGDSTPAASSFPVQGDACGYGYGYARLVLRPFFLTGFLVARLSLFCNIGDVA